MLLLFHSTDSEGREPLVLLLGWLGAQDKHLAKYSALYTARGSVQCSGVGGAW